MQAREKLKRLDQAQSLGMINFPICPILNEVSMDFLTSLVLFIKFLVIRACWYPRIVVYSYPP
ncbi:hypothetical protein ACJX0J_037385 [Zea mays]